MDSKLTKMFDENQTTNVLWMPLISIDYWLSRSICNSSIDLFIIIFSSPSNVCIISFVWCYLFVSEDENNKDIGWVLTKFDCFSH